MFLHHFEDDGFDLGMDLCVEHAGSWRSFVYMFVGQVAFDERQDTGCKFEECDAERIDIGACVNFVAEDLFGAHVVGRSDGLCGAFFVFG